jgi:hypothetical protein
MSDINPKRKCKGGAEKVRDKKLKILGKDGAKCRNLVDLFKATPIQTEDTSSQQTPSASKQPDTNRNDENNQHSVQSVVPTNFIPTLHLENVTEPSELTDNTTLAVADLNAENDSSEEVTETSVIYGQAYKHLFSAYKLLLTLSSTQVACERSFSKLKYIKNRLRSSLSSTHLEAFMLMSTETDVLSELNNDTIIDHVAEMAPGLKKLLIL